MPFAVPGRWRTMTWPATRTRAPCGICSSARAASTPSAAGRARAAPQARGETVPRGRGGGGREGGGGGGGAGREGGGGGGGGGRGRGWRGKRWGAKVVLARARAPEATTGPGHAHQ